MSKLIVIAKITAVEGQADAVKQALLELIAPTIQEDGCIQYDCHQDNQNPHLFYFYEIWESGRHLEAHGKSEHILAMRVKTKDMISSTELSLMTKLEA